MSTQWDTIGFVISSKYRLAVLRVLEDGPATTTEIAKAEDVSPPHISRALGRLRGRSLIKLLVPEDQPKNRRYGLTEEGRRTWQRIQAAGLAG